MNNKFDIEEMIDRVISDIGSNEEFMEMVELLAHNEEVSKKYVDACDNLSSINKVASCVKALDDDLLDIITDINKTTERIDDIVEDLDNKIEKLLTIKQRYRKCQTCSVESNMSKLEEQLNSINVTNIHSVKV